MQEWNSGGLIIDFYDDVHLKTLREDRVLLEKLGSMEIIPPDQMDKFPDDKFGLVILASPKRLRKFPIYDDKSTLLSKSYFEKNARKLTRPMQKVAAAYILRACKLYGIDGLEELEKIAEKNVPNTNWVELGTPDYEIPVVNNWEPYSLAYLPDSSFAYIKTASDKTYRMYPIDTPRRLKDGMAHFTSCHDELKPIERVKVANAMVRKAEELTIPVESEVVEKYATVSPNVNFDFYINLRKEALNTDTESIATLNGLIEKRAEFKGQSFGRALELFDEGTGLDSLWDVIFPDPYATCFDVSGNAIDAFGINKTAESGDWIKKLAESDKLGSVFSDSSVEEFRKDPIVVFNSLPAPTQAMLKNLHEENSQ